MLTRRRAVVWVIINELLPNAVRAFGFSPWSPRWFGCCARVSLVFPVVAAKSGAYAFGFFALMMVLQFVVGAEVPAETKEVFAGRTSEAPGREGISRD